MAEKAKSNSRDRSVCNDCLRLAKNARERARYIREPRQYRATVYKWRQDNLERFNAISAKSANKRYHENKQHIIQTRDEWAQEKGYKSYTDYNNKCNDLRAQAKGYKNYYFYRKSQKLQSKGGIYVPRRFKNSKTILG